MIEEIVKELLKKKVWTFEEISNINTLIEELTTIVYDTLSAKEKLDLVWGNPITLTSGEEVFGSLFQRLVRDSLYTKIAEAIKIELGTATINFEVNENEISKRSVGGEPHKESPTNEAADSEE